MKHVDLHMHTRYSDGTNKPAQNVIDCALIGLNAIAITDHDTTAGYIEAKSEAKNWNIEIIPGVEISTPNYHILGYGFDVQNDKLQDLLGYSRQQQKEQVKKRIEIIHSEFPGGIPISFEKVRAHFPYSRIGKYNLAMTLMKDDECREFTKGMSVFDVFTKYLPKSGAGGDVDGLKEVIPKEAIYAIHSAGGIAIIAHPFKDVNSLAELDVLVEQGIDGLEIQPNFKERNNPFIEYAKQKGLLVTYGSDYHGSSYLSRPLLGKNGNMIERFWR